MIPIEDVFQYTVIARDSSGKILVEQDFRTADYPDAFERAKDLYLWARKEHGDGKTVHGDPLVTLNEVLKRDRDLYRIMSAEEIGTLTETSQ